jgi:hypothetical protein
MTSKYTVKGRSERLFQRLKWFLSACSAAGTSFFVVYLETAR